jgi:hypothetical protein
MSEFKGTPGPWHWDDTVWSYDPEQQAPWLVDGNGDWVLCGEIKCNEANARLIAAAPDLLKALEGLLALAGKSCVGPWDVARQVVAQALGD